MWAVLSVSHCCDDNDKLKDALRQAFSPPIAALDAINQSTKFSPMTNEEKGFLSQRIIYAVCPYQDARVIFIKNSSHDYHCHIELKSNKCKDLVRISADIFEAIVNIMRKNSIKVILNKTNIRFYYESDEIAIIGKYRTVFRYIHNLIRGEGVYYALMMAIISIIIWIINKGIIKETLYLSIGTLIAFLILMLLMSTIIHLFKKKRIEFYVDQ